MYYHELSKCSDLKLNETLAAYLLQTPLLFSKPGEEFMIIQFEV